MSETSRDRYEKEFDPKQYLEQYYSLPQLATDDAELFRNLCGWLKQSGRRYATALDIGCGPTIHNSFALAPFVQRIDLADYLPANLAEIRKWLDSQSDAHNWDPLFHGVLEREGTDSDRLEDRKLLYRSRIGDLHQCDLRRPEPLGHVAIYYLVTSFFCAECVASDRDEWEVMINRIVNLVSSTQSGGVFIAAVRNCTRYRVLGREFSTVSVDELDIQRVLSSHGFQRVEAVVVPAPDWKHDGFDTIALAWAVRDD